MERDEPLADPEIEFIQPIREIIASYKDGSGEPLDGDEVDMLTEHVRNRINLHEGNITDSEYEELEEIIPVKISFVQAIENQVDTITKHHEKLIEADQDIDSWVFDLDECIYILAEEIRRRLHAKA